MRNKQNSYDHTGSSNDFGNNEGYQNYQDRTDRSFSNTPHYADKQADRQGYRNERSDYRSDYRAGSQGTTRNQNRSEWNRPSLQNSDRFESQQGSDYGTGSRESQSRTGYMPSNTSDASMYGADNQRQSGQYESGYGQGSSQSERFDARNNGNYGFGGYSSARGGYESSRFGQNESPQPSSFSGNFSWQNSEPKSGLHTGKGPKGYRRSDERIREEVSEFLSAHSEIDASEIEIDVKDGMVTLSGTVESRQIKRLVEDTIEAVSGVQDVKNDLRLMATSEISARSSSQDPDSTSSRASQGKTNLAGRQSASTQSTSSKSVQ